MKAKYSLNIEKFEILRQKGSLVLDIRSPSKFSNVHIPGSLNIELNENFISIAKYFIFKDQSIIIVSDIEKEYESIEKLIKLNYNNIGGYLEGGINFWHKCNKAIELVISIDSEELLLDIKHGNQILYDLRIDDDYNKLHVVGSQNIKVDTLLDDFEKIDNSNTTCIFCYDGRLSMSMISYLKMNGKYNLYHVSGGFKEIIKDHDIPVIRTPK